MAFTRRPQHQSTHDAKETEHTEVEVTEADVTEPDDEVKSPAKAVFTTPVKTEVQVVEVDEVPEVVEEKLVTIVPHVTLTSVRIGPKVYSFLKGVPVKVPSGVRAHLQEKGII